MVVVVVVVVVVSLEIYGEGVSLEECGEGGWKLCVEEGIE